MKKIIQKLFILAAALFTVSCNGDLNISQDNKLSASNMWKDANDVTTSTKGIYYLLRKNFQNRYTSVFYWAEARVGNYMWSTPQMTDISTKDCTDVLYNTMTSETSVCSWNLLYTVIDQANAVLKYAPDITMTESEAGFAYGQAYFARAFCYFWAARIWGDVPLVLVPIESPSQPETYPVRTEKEKVYAQVESDLENAGQYTKYLGKNKYYATTDALNVLKAEYSLWMYTTQNGGDGYLSKAQEALGALNISGSRLLSDYASIFSRTNKVNNEVIFALNNDQADGNTGSSYFANMYPYYTDVDSKYWSNPVPISGQFLDLSPSFQNVLQKSKDENNDSRVDCIYGHGNYGVGGKNITWVNKFLPAMTPGSNTYIFDVDLLYYRYALAVMLDAELKYYQDDYSGALKSLNIVAKRAYGVEDFYKETSKSAVLDALVHEYSIEFVEEGVIWWALIRLGKIEECNPTIAEYGKKNKNILLLPVSQDALNRNSNLTQTVGWGATD